MKCWNCHHLNNASDAECYMCGAVLHTYVPKAHPIIYVFVAMCVFLPVFSSAGGILKVLPWFDIPVKDLRSGGMPGYIPWLLGVIGISCCLYLSRTPFSAGTQAALAAVVVLVVWAAYIGFSVRLAKELVGTNRRPHVGRDLVQPPRVQPQFDEE